MGVLGIRGATTPNANNKEAIVDATEELLLEMVRANGIAEDDIAAVFFTTTKDLNAEFPAVAARVRLGWQKTALMNSQELDVLDAVPSVIRVLLLANVDRTKDIKRCPSLYLYPEGNRSYKLLEII